MHDDHYNPCQLDGFAFIEFSGNKALLEKQFTSLGFQAVAKHKTQDITRYQQGNIEFILNATKNSQAEEHAKTHGTGASAMGFKTKDAKAAFVYVLEHGAQKFEEQAHADHKVPAIKAIGGSVIYFVDDKHQPFDGEWETLPHSLNTEIGLDHIDHLTHNVHRGNMDTWAEFYAKLFNFREIRFFDIQGKMTGLISRALSSPCDKIKIPLNESTDDKSQIEEFLKDYNGEGIQHIALTSKDIYNSVARLKNQTVQFLDVPDTYYEMIDSRVPWHNERLKELQEHKILIDGHPTPEGGLLLQIFTENLFGPVFFEIIQRKGNQGFGEGNFKALFEAIERDQIRRGTL